MIHLAILTLLYFLPTIVASNRGHSVTGILLLNIFSGWTGIGWIVLLLWALLSYPPYPAYPGESIQPTTGAGKAHRSAVGYTFGEKSVSFINVDSCSFTNAPSFSDSAFSATHSGSAPNFAQLSVAATLLLCRSI